jgi:hypothetical protein
MPDKHPQIKITETIKSINGHKMNNARLLKIKSL